MAWLLNPSMPGFVVWLNCSSMDLGEVAPNAGWKTLSQVHVENRKQVNNQNISKNTCTWTKHKTVLQQTNCWLQFPMLQSTRVWAPWSGRRPWPQDAASPWIEPPLLVFTEINKQWIYIATNNIQTTNNMQATHNNKQLQRQAFHLTTQTSS